jgi:hypothetical protein
MHGTKNYKLRPRATALLVLHEVCAQRQRLPHAHYKHDGGLRNGEPHDAVARARVNCDGKVTQGTEYVSIRIITAAQKGR